MMLQYSHGEYQQRIQSQAHPTDVSSVSGTPEKKRSQYDKEEHQMIYDRIKKDINFVLSNVAQVIWLNCTTQ